MRSYVGVGPKLVIVHGGQTGCDRGAHVGALEAGLTIYGYMPKDGRDELGLIPAEVAAKLQRCTISGLAARTSTNLSVSHALLVVVPDKQNPYDTPGTRLTLVEARNLGLRRRVVDPTDSRDNVVQWVEELRRRHEGSVFRLMVAGPRASRWANGQTEAAAFVRLLRQKVTP